MTRGWLTWWPGAINYSGGRGEGRRKWVRSKLAGSGLHLASGEPLLWVYPALCWAPARSAPSSLRGWEAQGGGEQHPGLPAGSPFQVVLRWYSGPGETTAGRHQAWESRKAGPLLPGSPSRQGPHSSAYLATLAYFRVKN